MSEFKREERYIVVKIKDHSPQEIQGLRDYLLSNGMLTRECVVVEPDWPIYDETWENVQRVAEGRYSIQAEANFNAFEQRRMKLRLARALGNDAVNPSMCDLLSDAEQLRKERDTLASMHVDQVRYLWEERGHGGCVEFAEHYDALAAFANEAFDADFEGCDLDGAWIQERGAELGLIEAAEYDPEKHQIDCEIVEPGETIYVRKAWLGTRTKEPTE